MELKQLLERNALPSDLKMCYAHVMKKAKRLKNGWYVIILKNDMAIFYQTPVNFFSIGSVSRVLEAVNGCFMVVKKNKKRAIFTPSGEMLAKFSEKTNLYINGWYKKEQQGGLALFDAENKCIGSGLTMAKVAKDGSYAMAVASSENAKFAGVYAPDGTRLLFTNDPNVHFFKNGWFIADNCLYDNQGEAYIELNHSTLGSKSLSALLLYSAASIMPRFKNH